MEKSLLEVFLNIENLKNNFDENFEKLRNLVQNFEIENKKDFKEVFNLTLNLQKCLFDKKSQILVNTQNEISKFTKNDIYEILSNLKDKINIFIENIFEKDLENKEKELEKEKQDNKIDEVENEKKLFEEKNKNFENRLNSILNFQDEIGKNIFELGKKIEKIEKTESQKKEIKELKEKIDLEKKKDFFNIKEIEKEKDIRKIYEEGRKNSDLTQKEILEKSHTKNIEEKDKETLKNLDKIPLKIIQNNRIDLYFFNEKIPYLKIDFKKNTDNKTINDIKKNFCEIFGFEEADIKEESNIIFIKGVSQKENIVILKSQREDKILDLKEAISKIFSKSKFQRFEEIDIKNCENEFYNYSNEEGQNSKTDIKKEDEKIILEKDNKIIIEKKDENEIQKEEIQKYSDKKENVELKDIEYSFYEDDVLIAYLDKKSKVLGEVLLKSKKANSFLEISNEEFSYMNIFSKVFSSIVFEITKAAATNILYDINSSIIRIVPRFLEDNVSVNKNPQKKADDKELENFRENLLKKMFEKNQKVEENKEKQKEKEEAKENEKSITKKLIKKIRRIV